MAILEAEPKQGGNGNKCMADKTSSIIVGWVQLIFWIFGFVAIISKAFTQSDIIVNASAKVIVMAGFIILICMAFSVVLLIGLHKNKRGYIKGYCIFAVVYLIFLVLSFITNLFLHPEKIGFHGFFSMFLCFLLHLLFFLVVRSYYLATYCNINFQQFSNEPKV